MPFGHLSERHTYGKMELEIAREVGMPQRIMLRCSFVGGVYCLHSHVGSVYTSDFFYHPDKEVNNKAKSLGLLAVEMEAAGLYLTAMAAHKKALAIFTISDHIYTGESLSAEERQTTFRDMMEIALETAE